MQHACKLQVICHCISVSKSHKRNGRHTWHYHHAFIPLVTMPQQVIWIYCSVRLREGLLTEISVEQSISNATISLVKLSGALTVFHTGKTVHLHCWQCKASLLALLRLLSLPLIHLSDRRVHWLLPLVVCSFSIRCFFIVLTWLCSVCKRQSMVVNAYSCQSALCSCFCFVSFGSTVSLL